MDQKTKTLFVNYFTKLKLILFIKGFQGNFFNIMNCRHFVVLFLLPFTESTYRSCIFLICESIFLPFLGFWIHTGYSALAQDIKNL